MHPSARTPYPTLQRLLSRMVKWRYLWLALLIHAVVLVYAGTQVEVTGQGTMAEAYSFDDLVVVSGPFQPIEDPLPPPPPPPPPQLPTPAGPTPEMLRLFLASRDISALGVAPFPHDTIFCQLPVEAVKPKPPRKPSGIFAAQDRALAWLHAHQNVDGSWGERQQAELTSLVLMAFWKEGWGPDLSDGGEALQKGLLWLAKNGKEHAGRLSMGAAEWEPGAVRAHAMATRVLADYCAFSKDESLLEAIKAAAAYIVGGQAPDGGWADQYQKIASDLEVSIWQVLALKSVHLTGLKLPGVDAALDGAIKFVDTKRASDGSYAQSTNDTAVERDRETAVALLVEMMWKDDRQGQRESVKYLVENHGGEGQLDYQGAATSLEGVYFRMNAMLYFGGSAWTTWDRTFSDLIRNAQSEDGSWPPMTSPGYRNLQSANDLSGAVYRTAMVSLCIPPFRIRGIPMGR